MRWLLRQKAAEAESKDETQLDTKIITLDHWKKGTQLKSRTAGQADVSTQQFSGHKARCFSINAHNVAPLKTRRTIT